MELRDLLRQPQNGSLARRHVQFRVRGAAFLRGKEQVLAATGQRDDLRVSEGQHLLGELDLRGRQGRFVRREWQARQAVHAAHFRRVAEIAERSQIERPFRPHDPDAKVAKMKDGSTHLAHKVKHAVDLETGAVVGVTIQGADAGDTTTMVETLVTAAEQVEAVLPAAGVSEVVADKGYHSN